MESKLKRCYLILCHLLSIIVYGRISSFSFFLVYCSYMHFLFQVISFTRGPLLFIFNFHPTNSYDSYGVGIEEAGEYQVSISSYSSLVIFLLLFLHYLYHLDYHFYDNNHSFIIFLCVFQIADLYCISPIDT